MQGASLHNIFKTTSLLEISMLNVTIFTQIMHRSLKDLIECIQVKRNMVFNNINFPGWNRDAAYVNNTVDQLRGSSSWKANAVEHCELITCCIGNHIYIFSWMLNIDIEYIHINIKKNLSNLQYNSCIFHLLTVSMDSLCTPDIELLLVPWSLSNRMKGGREGGGGGGGGWGWGWGLGGWERTPIWWTWLPTRPTYLIVF